MEGAQGAVLKEGSHLLSLADTQHQGCLDQPFSMEAIRPPEGPSTLEGGHILEIVLHKSPYKAHRAIYLLLIQPVFLSCCVYGHAKI